MKWPSVCTRWVKRKRPRYSSPRDSSGRTSSPNKTAPSRGRFAIQLARVDLPSALAIAREFPASGTYTANWSQSIALHLAADDPDEAERILRQVPRKTGRAWLPPTMARKIATVDPARARGWSKNHNDISTNRGCICTSLLA